MLAVVDTNIWVSAFLSPGGTPAKLLTEFKRGRLALMVCEEIEAEYREVLYRPQFKISVSLLDAFLQRVREESLRVRSLPKIDLSLPDPDDAVFIAVAKAANCPIVTGNARHFPAAAGVEILSPAECIERLFKA